MQVCLEVEADMKAAMQLIQSDVLKNVLKNRGSRWSPVERTGQKREDKSSAFQDVRSSLELRRPEVEAGNET